MRFCNWNNMTRQMHIKLQLNCHVNELYRNNIRCFPSSSSFCYVLGLLTTTIKAIYTLARPCGIRYTIQLSLKRMIVVLSFLPVFAANSWNRLSFRGRLIALSCVWIYLNTQFVLATLLLLSEFYLDAFWATYKSNKAIQTFGHCTIYYQKCPKLLWNAYRPLFNLFSIRLWIINYVFLPTKSVGTISMLQYNFCYKYIFIQN